MILGIGTDMADMRRIKASLDRFGDRFIDRVFSKAERERAEQSDRPESRSAVYAKRFAAKEAVAKALGTGYAEGVHFKDIEVANDMRGRPFILLHGGAAARLAALTPPGYQARIEASMTDEPPYALAFIVIHAVAARAEG
jgi:holo-[acyl-carrier protein] synthase